MKVDQLKGPLGNKYGSMVALPVYIFGHATSSMSSGNEAEQRELERTALDTGPQREHKDGF